MEQNNRKYIEITSNSEMNKVIFRSLSEYNEACVKLALINEHLSAQYSSNLPCKPVCLEEPCP